MRGAHRRVAVDLEGLHFDGAGPPSSNSLSRSSLGAGSGGWDGGLGGGLERGGPGARPGAEREEAPSPYFTDNDLNTSLVTPLSVSSTPTPLTATAS